MNPSSKERAVIGTMLAECPAPMPEPFLQLLSHAPDSFDDLRLAEIALAIRALHGRERAIDVVSVRRELESRAKLETVGGDDFVRSLVCESLPIGTAIDDAKELWGLYRSRRFLSVLRDGVASAEINPHKIDSIAEHVVSTVADLNRERNERKLTVRRPSEILGMAFDDSDVILGDRVVAKGQFATILGPGGLGKSRYVLQMAAASIAGRLFPGFEIRRSGLNWTIIQVENSNRRLQSDFEALRRWAGQDWPTIDRHLSIHTLESDEDGFLCLANPQTQIAIEELITDTKPDVVVFDPLKDFGIGDLNKDEDMMSTVRTLARLTRKGNPDRAGIVLHHSLTGKAGASRATGYERSSYGRNSKVLQAWTRAQINIAPGSSDSNTSLVVSCGKLSNGREFAPHAVCLNQETMIYELDPTFDFAAWESETSGKAAKIELTHERVAGLCVGAMSKSDLVKAIIADSGVSRSKAYMAVEQAQKAKRIHPSPVTGTYVRKA